MDVAEFALITGASGGIGRAVAMELAREGYNLYLHYHEGEEAIRNLLECLNMFGGEYLPVQADLSQSSGVKQLVEGVFSLDAIIHCSGIGAYGLLVEMAAEEVMRVMNLHVTNPMLLTQQLLPKFFAKRNGNVIFISSIWGQTGAACEVAYSTAKGAQIAFVKALSKEVARSGIRVNAIAPGAVDTAMMSGFSGEEMAALLYEIPMGRLALPEEIANGVSFLLSDKSAYITGQTLAINGGWYT